MAKSELEKEIVLLETKLATLKSQWSGLINEPSTVKTPPEVSDLFLEAERRVQEYFNQLHFDPQSGEITVNGERYILLRSASLSVDFMDFILERYKEKGKEEATSIGNNFLYDNAKVIGKQDALAFHKKLKLKNPIDKLSAGPVHFAFTGWANVEIENGSNPVADESYFLKFIHHNSFEAQSWLKKGKKSKIPVCTMNCGYSAGWCEESFGLRLTTVELTCEAQGAEHCSFIMAPTDRIEEYVGEAQKQSANLNVEIPVFFKRKHIEEQLRSSITQKESLIQEIHHRVKNNLQIVISLLRLQQANIEDSFAFRELDAAINRMGMMATVHELLYQRLSSNKIEIEDYFRNLIAALFQLYSVDNNVNLELEINADNAEISIDESIPLALILNEITCNSFKHALANGGTFKVSIIVINNVLEIVLADNGPGIVETENNNGLGLSLIDILSEQIDARIERKSSNLGLCYKIEVDI